MLKNSFQKGSVKISTFAGMAIIAAIVVIVSTIAVIKYRGISNIIAPAAMISPKLSLIVTPITDETAGWQTYNNDKYKIAMRYPSDWRVVDFQTETNMGTLDTFGFIPVNLKNSYCNLEADASNLIQNYKNSNPFSGYEEYAQTAVKVDFCSIQIRAEENPDKLSIKNYLKKVYAPITVITDKVQVEGKIDSLKEIKSGNTEQTTSNYAFTKFLGGIDGSYLETSIDENKNQIIITTGNYIIFITNQINQPVDSRITNNLFDQILSTFKFTK